ncbi:hypothetical protein LINPERPRIM_LOCUS41198, partial [Linum perenne]
MKSSGRWRNLKYQRKGISSPMKGRPMCSGGTLFRELIRLNLAGAAYRSSFH